MSSPDPQPLVPEVVDQFPTGDGLVGPVPEGVDGNEPDEQVLRPTKLIRIASMVRTMLEEVRRAPLDDAGRRALRQIHERSLHELEDILSPELKAELEGVTIAFDSDTPSESELRIAQAQLVGWLEGLFHGIQATLFTQQAMAQQQFEEMRRRQALQIPGQGGGGPMGGGRPDGDHAPGAYL